MYDDKNPNRQAAVLKDALNLQVELNGRAPFLAIHRPPGTEGRTGGAVTEFHFKLAWPRSGAAVLAMTWVLAALEAHCAPVEEVQFDYADNGAVTATVFVGSGWLLPDGMQDFIGLVLTQPRVAAFEWSLDVLPHYSYVAARTIAQPERFERIGAQVKAAIEVQATLFIPDVLCPCGSPRIDNNSPEARRDTQNILHALRTGQLRWRNLGRQA